MTIIREISESDFQNVSDLLCACYRWFEDRESFTPDQIEYLISERGSVEHVRDIARDELCLVADKGGRVVGMVAIKGNEIDKLYVDPEYHRQGIGTLLFRAAEDTIKRAGHHDMFLGAMARSAVPFYDRMGMYQDGYKHVQTGAFAGEKALILRKELQET